MKRSLMNAFWAPLLSPLLCFAQPSIPIKDGKVIYEAIDSVPGVEKSELYTRSKIWFVNTFKSAKAVLQLDDKDAGIVMGKGITSSDIGSFMTGPMRSNVNYTISINLKDGRYRMQVYDIFVSNNENRGTYTPEEILKYPKMNKKKIERIDLNVKDLIAGFRQSMNRKPSADF